MASLTRYNFSKECEDILNNQIQAETQAGYTYLAISTWFAKDSVALLGFSKLFSEFSKEEYEHSQKFIDYLTQRGGTVKLQAIEAPPFEFTSAIGALQKAMEMEKAILERLLQIVKVASDCGDPELEDFITSEYLHQQVIDMKKLSDMITQLHRAGDSGLGLHLFDKSLM